MVLTAHLALTSAAIAFAGAADITALVLTPCNPARRSIEIGLETSPTISVRLSPVPRLHGVDGGTFISCGIDRGHTELRDSPIAGGLRRMVLNSDGQANEGVWDRDELAQLASDTAARGVSISSVGVGLDFDEVTMIRLAEV